MVIPFHPRTPSEDVTTRPTYTGKSFECHGLKAYEVLHFQDTSVEGTVQEFQVLRPFYGEEPDASAKKRVHYASTLAACVSGMIIGFGYTRR